MWGVLVAMPYILVESEVKKWPNEIGKFLLSCSYAWCDIYGA